LPSTLKSRPFGEKSPNLVTLMAVCLKPIFSFVFLTSAGLPDFYRYNIPTREKLYQKNIKSTKWPQNIPNGHKIYQMTVKYTNILHCKSLQNLPKLVFLAIFCHLATLHATD
jgi:hypothetical protein